MKPTVLLFLFLLSTLVSVAQDRSEMKTGIWTLTLPDGDDGPMTFTFNYEYQFERECLGNSGCHVNLKFNITNINVVPLAGNGYGFRFNGKSYFCDVLTQYDQRGIQGFDDIEVTSFTIDNLIIYGGEGGDRFNMATSMRSKWKAAKVTEYTDLNKLILDFTLSRTRNVNYNNTTVARERILSYNQRPQSTQNTVNNNNASGSTAASSNATGITSTGNQNNNSGATTNKNTNPLSTSGSTGTAPVSTSALSEKVLVNGQYVQVYEQNGIPYMLEADGRRHETSREVYDYVMTQSNKMGSSQQTSGPSTQSNTIEDEPMPDFNNGKSMEQLTLERDQAIQNAVNTGANILDYYLTEAAENRERKYAQQQKLYDEAVDDEVKKFEVRQQSAIITMNQALKIFNNYAETATDDNKMNLIFFCDIVNYKYSYYSGRTSQYYSVQQELEALIPDKQKWVEQAMANGNFHAILYRHGYIQTQEDVEKLTIIAEKGSLDAMITLVEFYNKRRKVVDGELVGKDEIKALYWLKKAAENGCPKANYFLGMIYKYGYTNETYKSYNLKYTVKKDLQTAFDYFSKSVKLANYPASSFAKYKRHESRYLFGSSYNIQEYETGISIFNSKALDELSLFHKKGEVVEQSQSEADILLQQSKGYAKDIVNINFTEDITDGFKYNIGDWMELNNDEVVFDIDESVENRYILETKKPGSYFTTLPVLDLSTDFSIRFQVKRVSGAENATFGFVVGQNVISNNYHLISKVGSTEFVFKDKIENGTEVKKNTSEIKNGRVGFGFVVKENGAEIKTLAPNGAAAKSNLIVQGDLITKIAQGNGTPEAIAGKTYDEIREKLIGQPGSIVKLTIKKNNGQIKVVELTRTASGEDWIVYKEGNKLSFSIDGEIVFDNIDVKSLYGNNFGFMISSDSNPCRIEIENLSFQTLY